MKKTPNIEPKSWGVPIKCQNRYIKICDMSQPSKYEKPSFPHVHNHIPHRIDLAHHLSIANSIAPRERKK